MELVRRFAARLDTADVRVISTSTCSTSNARRTRATNPSWVREADEFVLKVPKAGLPPLFHVTSLSLDIFISSDARAALKAAKVTGVIDYPLLQGSRYATRLPIGQPDILKTAKRDDQRISRPPCSCSICA